MKELTIKEKAEAYDKAIEAARCIYNNMKDGGNFGGMEDLEVIFPELAESEDEKIRKALINGFNKLDKSAVWYNGITNAQILDWLEKQGEHANFRNKIQIGDKVTRNRDGVLVNLSQLNRVAKVEEKQGEQKPTDVRTTGYWHVEDTEQNPAWSEEDEKVLHAIRNALNYEKPRNYLKSRDFEFTDILDWLKSLKDRVQPKQEWSEKDEEMLKMVIKLCEQCGNEYAYYWLKSLKNRVQPKQEWEWSEEDEINWLNFIRLQNRWKPSEEQMKAFDAILVYNPPCSNECRNHLITLYNELKKLREK